MKNLSKIKLLSVFVVLSMVAMSFGMLEEVDSTPSGGAVIYELQFELDQSSPGAAHDKVTNMRDLSANGLYALSYNYLFDLSTSEVELPNGEWLDQCTAYSVSNDGIIVGIWDNGTTEVPGIWDPVDGWHPVPVPWGDTDDFSGVATDISPDGRYVVGHVNTQDGVPAQAGFIYDRFTDTCSGEIVSSMHPTTTMYLYSVSDDGSVVGGFTSDECPVTWIDGTEYYPFGAGETDKHLQVVCGDGSRVSGVDTITNKMWVCDADGSNKMEYSGPFNWPAAGLGRVKGMSYDGDIIVGYEFYNVFCPGGGFVWTPTRGYETPATYLSWRGVSDCAGWGQSYGLVGVSGNGNEFLAVIVGANSRVDSYLVCVTRPQTPKPSTIMEGMSTYVTDGITRLDCTVTDSASGYSDVELWYKTMNPDYSPRTDWVKAGSMTWDAANGVYYYNFDFTLKGYYQFYSIGVDTYGWREPAPARADVATSCTFGGPSSIFGTTTPYEQHGESVKLIREYDAWPGLKDQETTYYRHRPNNGSTWSGWAEAVMVPSLHPYFKPADYGIPSGSFIEFESVIHSTGAGWEVYNGVPDTQCQWFDTSIPWSAVMPYAGGAWTSRSTESMYMVADNAVTKVDLYYREQGNVTWIYHGTDTSPGTNGEFKVTFDFPNGDGIYEFNSRAWITALPEGAKTHVEATLGRDTAVPYSGVENFTQYAYTTSPQTFDIVYDAVGGLDYAGVWYRYSETNDSWTGWTKYATIQDSPWEFEFDFPHGSGYYQFNTRSVGANGKEQYPSEYPDTPVGPGAICSYFAPTTDFDLYLDDGWNLVSAPADYSMTIAQLETATVGGDILAVSAFDPATQTWVHQNDAMETAGITSTLSSVDQTVSYWLLFDDTSTVGDGAITFTDGGLALEADRTTTLSPGWNLVGYPSYTGYINVSESFGSIWSNGWISAVQEMDGTPLYAHSGLEEGQGYWVYLDHTSSADWIAPL